MLRGAVSKRLVYTSHFREYCSQIQVSPDLKTMFLSILWLSFISLSFSKIYKVLKSLDMGVRLSSLNVTALNERKEIYIWAMAEKLKHMENRSMKSLKQKLLKYKDLFWTYSYACWKQNHLLKYLFKWIAYCKVIAPIGSKKCEFCMSSLLHTIQQHTCKRKWKS